MTAKLLTPFLVVIPAILFGLYQIRFKPLLEVGGVWKEVQDIGRELKDSCTYVDELKGCEQIILDEPSGNTSGAGVGYIATYDPSLKKVTKLAANGFDNPRGLSAFGMDIVPSTNNPDELTIYATNIRPPHVDLNPDLPPGIREAKRDEVASARAKGEGPDPSIELFRHLLGSDSMQHVATWADEKIMTSPNDVVGLADGKGVWFTNPLPYKVGISNDLSVVLQQKRAWIGFCGADGCKHAATGLYTPNGITRSPFYSNDTFYVAHTFLGGLDEHIPTESVLDNLSVDSKGVIWAAGLPKLLTTRAHFLYPTQGINAPSSVFKIALNVGESSFYGEKYTAKGFGG